MNRIRASFTVEAALLFPFMVLLTIYVLYWGEWQYNNRAADAVALRAVVYGINLLEAGEPNVTDRTYHYAVNALDEVWLGQVNYELSLHLRGNKVEVLIEGRMKSPLPWLFTETAQKKYEDIYAAEEGKWIDSPEWVRLIKAARR